MSDRGHVYSADFYDYISDGSRSSAEAIVPMVLGQLKVGSVLDVGAGNGAWLAAWMGYGVSDALAVDGAYVDTCQLAVPTANFLARDLSKPLDLRRRFDLVQSLEVAEHLPREHADDFIESLCRHGDIVMFSAAVPNQGGEFHVNEQPGEYWRRKFAVQGYECFDWLRPLIASQSSIKPWYRFNIAIYANQTGQLRLGEEVRAALVAQSSTFAERGNLAWRARRLAVALMPKTSVHGMAVLKSAIEARRHARDT